MNNIPTLDEYIGDFRGSGAENMSETGFSHLAEGAAELLSAVCGKDLAGLERSPSLMRAVCWQIELLLHSGGVSALAAPERRADRQTVGEITLSWRDEQDAPAYGGIPVSPLAVHLLRSAGLMCRAGRG